MNDFTKGQLIELCQSVKRGAKPLAMVPILVRDKEDANWLISDAGCKFLNKPLSNGWVEIWIYTRNELMYVIADLPDNPTTSADHYLLGALFGYSNDAICDYIKNELG